MNAWGMFLHRFKLRGLRPRHHTQRTDTMTKVIATKAANRFIVQFADGKTYSALVETVGNRLEVYRARSFNSAGNVKSYTLDRHSGLLSASQMQSTHN